MIQAIHERPPQVLGLTNYLWNASLSIEVFRFAKSLSPNTVTVSGGPNYAHQPDRRGSYWDSNKDIVDYYVVDEGEVTFVELLTALHDKGFTTPSPNLSIAGLDYCDAATGQLVTNPPRQRLANIETEVPSPILNGDLDKFMHMPGMLQTTRGCPYRCAFCHEGSEYYNRVYRFSLERITAEVECIKAGSDHSFINFTDSNFGMQPEDLELIRFLADLRDKTGFPTFISVSTTKKLNERFVEAAILSKGLLRVGLHFQVSVQSRTVGSVV